VEAALGADLLRVDDASVNCTEAARAGDDEASGVGNEAIMPRALEAGALVGKREPERQLCLQFGSTIEHGHDFAVHG
jgi:hypothetical protein